MGEFLSNESLCGSPILLTYDTGWNRAKGPSSGNVTSFPSPDEHSSSRAISFLTSVPQDTRFEINSPVHFTSYFTAYSSIRNHLRWQLFQKAVLTAQVGRNFPSASAVWCCSFWASRKHLPTMPPTYLSSPDLILGRGSAITMTLAYLTQSLIHVKTFWDSLPDSLPSV